MKKIANVLDLIEMDPEDYNKELEKRCDKNKEFKEAEEKFLNAIDGFEFEQKDAIDQSHVSVTATAMDEGFKYGFQVATQLILSTLSGGQEKGE